MAKRRAPPRVPAPRLAAPFSGRSRLRSRSQIARGRSRLHGSSRAPRQLHRPALAAFQARDRAAADQPTRRCASATPGAPPWRMAGENTLAVKSGGPAGPFAPRRMSLHRGLKHQRNRDFSPFSPGDD